MPSTYTLNNGIELIGTGEQSGTWGDTTNTNLSLLDTALDGQVTVTLATAGTSGSPNALPISDGSASDGRNRMIIFADSGDLGATAYVQLTPNDAEKIIYIRNDLSGSRSILFFQGTYNASNDYEVPAGTTAVVYFDGAGAGAVAANVFNNAYFDSLRLGSVSVTAILDEDNMASDSATALATQQSIKAYVDTQVGANNELSEVLANGNTSGGNAIQMTTTDELQFRDTALKISSSADGQLDIDADTEIEIVAPTVDIDASTAMTIDTAALTVTGAVDFNTSLNVDGTVTSDGLTVAGNLSVDSGTIKLDGNYPVGTQNLGMGDTALDSLDAAAYYNVAFGPRALTTQTTGNSNTALGQDALRYNETSSNNTAVGTSALVSNTTGGTNTAIGRDALQANTTASGNTMAGYQAGYLVGDEIVATAIVSGVNYTIQTLGTTDFTLIGAGANTVGTTFTATGAGTGTGTASANANYNTFVGYQSGDEMIGGSRNTIIGSFNGNQNTVDIRNSDYNIVISDGNGNPRMFYNNSVPELVFNEQSSDVDFRVESDGNANMLFVNAGNNRVGIGTGVPQTDLHVRAGSTSTLAIGGVGLNETAKLLLAENLDGSGAVNFGFSFVADGAATNDLLILAHDNNTAGVEQIRIERQGGVTVNESGADIDFRVESDSNTHMLFVDASSSEVGIGTNDPRKTLDIAGELQVRKAALIASPKTITYTGDTDAWDSGGAVQHTLQHYYIAAPTAQQYRKIAVLPASSGVTGEKLKIRVFISALQESDYYEYDIVIGQRNNFAAMLFNAQGTSSSYKSIAGIKCYTQTDGSTDVYMWTASGAGYYYGFTAECWADGFAQTADLISPADVVTINTVPTGTLVFDSTNDTYHKTRFYVSEGTVNVNDGGQDIDFRVESDANSHMLFVDAGNDQVVVGTSTPITGVGAAMTIGGLSDTRLAIDGSTSSGLYLTDSGAQGITIRNASGDLEFYGITTREFVFNAGSIDTDFRVESDTNTHALFVDASSGTVSINTTSNSYALNVAGGIATAGSDAQFLGLVLDRGIAWTPAGSTGSIYYQVNGLGASEAMVFGIGATNDAFIWKDAAGSDKLRFVPATPKLQFLNGVSIDSNAPTYRGSIILAESTTATANGGIEFMTSSGGGAGYGSRIRGESATMFFESRNNASTWTQALLLQNNAVVINEDSNDQDFRVESVGNSNMIGLDAANNVLGIGKFGATAGAGTKGAYFNDAADGFFHLVVTHENTTADQACIYANRQSNDGQLIQFRQADSPEGNISVSGSTVSYNGFAGRHESSGIPTTTVKGTVVSTIDELDVYVSGAKQGQTRADHAKVKISDTAGESCVYGVVDDFTEDGKVNVISVGIGAVLVTGPCSKGDLLESNGDGTAKVQSDDIVRSKTIGKVTIGNSEAGVKLVPCVLYCG